MRNREYFLGSCLSTYNIERLTMYENPQEEFEDTKGVIRNRISKNRQHNDQKKKYTWINNDLQNIHINLRVSWTTLKTEGEFECSGSVWSYIIVAAKGEIILPFVHYFLVTVSNRCPCCITPTSFLNRFVELVIYNLSYWMWVPTRWRYDVSFT